MRISDWSSDVCSSDLDLFAHVVVAGNADVLVALELHRRHRVGLAVFGLDQVPGALEVAPADRRRPSVLRFVQLVVLAAEAGAAGGQPHDGDGPPAVFPYPHRVSERKSTRLTSSP